VARTQDSAGVLRFDRPGASLSPGHGGPAGDQLFNLRVVGLNVNRYLNRQLLELKQIGQVRDAAVMREYGGQMH